eukprot:1348724-Rhodomonas_salina.3
MVRPGVPVYVTTGVTLGAVGEEYLGNFAYAMLWAILVRPSSQPTCCHVLTSNTALLDTAKATDKATDKASAKSK